MKNLIILEGLELCVILDSIQFYKEYLQTTPPNEDEEENVTQDIKILTKLEDVIGKLLDEEIKEIKK